jgi:hypothetical protein
MWHNRRTRFLWIIYSSSYSNYSNIYPTRCNVTQFILSGNCTTCFGWYLHPSSGAQTTVCTASGICHAVTATCSYRGKGGKLNKVKLWQLFAYTTQRIIQTTTNLHYVWWWCHSNMEMCLSTYVIYNFKISRFLIFNFNDESDGD